MNQKEDDYMKTIVADRSWKAFLIFSSKSRERSSSASSVRRVQLDVTDYRRRVVFIY